MAAELDLERRADRIQAFGVVYRPALEQLELAFAVRAHAIGKGETLAHLAAGAAPPAEIEVGAANVDFIAFDRTVALWTGDHDWFSLFGVAASSASGGAKASESSWVMGHFCLPVCR